jgi:acyl-CoA thioesterase FadM
MEYIDNRAIGRAHFTTPYEGPPGCVHGAVLAGVFDQVFNVANILGATAGPTVSLELKYKKPTPLFEDLVFEAWVELADERRITTRGFVRHGDVVCVESVGIFARLSKDRALNLLG